MPKSRLVLVVEWPTFTVHCTTPVVGFTYHTFPVLSAKNVPIPLPTVAQQIGVPTVVAEYVPEILLFVVT